MDGNISENDIVLSFVLVCFVLVTESVSLHIPPVNNSKTFESDGYMIYDTATTGTLMDNCTLLPKFKSEKENIRDLVRAGNTHVKISIKIEGDNGPFSEDYAGQVFRPRNWIIVTSLTGQRILALKEYFVEMSIQIFGQGMVKAEMTLIQNQSDCLKYQSQDQIENSLRQLFLRNFESDATILLEGAEICNKHVKRVDGEGKVVHICCHQKMEKELECFEIQKSKMMKVLFHLITVLKWTALSCFPLFIPYFIYRARYVEHKYIFQTEDDDPIKFNLLKVSEFPSDESGAFEEGKLHKSTHMTEFKKLINSKVKKPNTIYQFYLKEILLNVRSNKIIARGRPPVSVMRFVYNFFVRCKMRHVIPSGICCCDAVPETDCCGAKILRCPTHKCESKCTYTWYDCLKYLMGLITLCVCFSPLTIRLIFYLLYERTFVLDQKALMEKHNLNLHFDKTELTEYPLTSLLSSNYFYIVMIFYTLIPIEWLIYKLCFPTDLKRKVMLTFRESVRDMRLTNKSKLFSYYIGLSLLPLQKYGIVAILAFPIWSFILCVPLAVEIIPVCNFIGQLIKNFKSQGVILASFKKTKVTLHYISQFVVIFTLLFILIPIMECISFYVEWFIYVVIGFILNPGVSLRYASMIILIAVYENECFSGVHRRYVSYNNTLNSKVLEMVGEKVKAVASLSATEQVNTVFRVPVKPQTKRMQIELQVSSQTTKEEKSFFPCLKSKKNNNINCGNMKIFERGSDGFLKWRDPRLVLFLDKSDMVYIPKSFLFKMAELSHYICPGPVHLLYLKAVIDFSLIIIFLVFVFIVIFAFGQVQNVSTGGQTIAALGSGLLPLFLRRFFFRSQEFPDTDGSDLQWRYMLENAIQTYSERWNFEDIIVSEFNEVCLTTLADKSEVSDLTVAATPKADENENQSTNETTSTSPDSIAPHTSTEIEEEIRIPLMKQETEKHELEIPVHLIIVAEDDKDELSMKFYVPRA